MKRLYLLLAPLVLACNVSKPCALGDAKCSFLALGAFNRISYPHFVYSANLSAGTITSYSVDHITDSMASVGSTNSTNTNLVSMHPAGTFLYSANSTPTHTITSYAIDPSNGTLTLAANVPAAGANPYLVVLDRAGRFAYVVNNSLNTVGTYALDSTGNLTLVGSVSSNGTNSNYAALNPDGTILYVANKNGNNISSFSVSSSGVLTLLGQAAITNPIAVAVDPFNRYLYATDLTTTLKIFSIASDGSITQITTAPVGTLSSFVCVSANGRFLYVTNQTTNDVSVISVNAGFASLGNRSSNGTTAVGCATEPSGKYLFITNSAGSPNFVVFNIKPDGDLNFRMSLPAATGAQGLAVQLISGF